MFLTCREPGVPLSLFRPYPLPFSLPFPLYCSLPFLFFYVFFIDLYLLLFPGRHSICCLPTVAICFWPAGNLECPCLFPTLFPFPFLILFFYIVPFTVPFLLCLFHWSISAVVPGRHSICCFPTVAICFWPAGNLECPCLFSDLILFPFLLLFFYIVPYPSFSSMPP